MLRDADRLAHLDFGSRPEAVGDSRTMASLNAWTRWNRVLQLLALPLANWCSVMNIPYSRRTFDSGHDLPACWSRNHVVTPVWQHQSAGQVGP